MPFQAHMGRPALELRKHIVKPAPAEVLLLYLFPLGDALTVDFDLLARGSVRRKLLHVNNKIVCVLHLRLTI